MTTITILSIVIYRLLVILPNLGIYEEKVYLDLVIMSLSFTTMLRAALTTNTMGQAAMNLNALTKFSEWLLFGGIHRSESFTDMINAADQCNSSRDMGT